MTVKEGLKVSQQTRVQIKQGECPPAPGSKTSTVGLQFTSKKEQKKKILQRLKTPTASIQNLRPTKKKGKKMRLVKQYDTGFQSSIAAFLCCQQL